MTALLKAQDMDYFDDKIVNLKAELTSYSKDIMVLLNGIYGSNSFPTSHKGEETKYDLKNNPLQMIQYLKLELTELLEQSQENKEILKRYENDLNYCNELINILNNISKIIDLFNSIELLLSKCKFVDASEVLIKLENEINALPKLNQEINSGYIYKIIRNERNLIKIRFKNLMRKIFNEFVVIETGSVKIQRKISDYLKCEEKVLDQPILLKDILTAIENVDFVSDIIDEITDNIWKLLLVPLWKEKKVQAPSISVNNEYAEFILASILRGFESSSLQNHHPAVGGDSNTSSFAGEIALGVSKLPLPDLFDYVGHLITFIWSEMFLGNEAVRLNFFCYLHDVIVCNAFSSSLGNSQEPNSRPILTIC
jgi:hypothetical protein